MAGNGWLWLFWIPAGAGLISLLVSAQFFIRWDITSPPAGQNRTDRSKMIMPLFMSLLMFLAFAGLWHWILPKTGLLDIASSRGAFGLSFISASGALLTYLFIDALLRRNSEPWPIRPKGESLRISRSIVNWSNLHNGLDWWKSGGARLPRRLEVEDRFEPKSRVHSRRRRVRR